jgi:hypothetical protein
MTLKTPFSISSRLLPALQVGDTTIQLEYDGSTNDGRTRYQWTIDLPDGSEHIGRDLKSGCGGGDLQSGFESLVAFLGAAAESWRYKGEKSENADLFPQPVVEWAAQNSDELACLQCELEETEELIKE